MIYEGANGVQALDLVGRKLAQDGASMSWPSLKWSKTLLGQQRMGRRF